MHGPLASNFREIKRANKSKIGNRFNWLDGRFFGNLVGADNL
jgi:hypothetical protein